MKQPRRLSKSYSRQKRELARAYFVFQRYTRRYSAREGLQKGTIFPELYRPYVSPCR